MLKTDSFFSGVILNNRTMFGKGKIEGRRREIEKNSVSFT